MPLVERARPHDGAAPATAVRLRGACVRYGSRVLWEGLDLDVEAGEFVAVLGPNGTGKTTLLNVLLGLTPLSSGTVEVNGRRPRRGDRRIGYVPQQKAFDPDLPIRGRDLVRFGLDGYRPGLPLSNRQSRTAIDAAIAAVGAERYAAAPIGLLSGGEQQRLRIAQALIGDPHLLLCDEPLLSLDLAHQHGVTRLLHERRVEANSAVVFVTHDINPVLDYVDRILYLVNGRWAIGHPRDVMTSERLTDLYGTPVDVLDVRGRLVVVGSDTTGGIEDYSHHVHADTPHHHAHDHPGKRQP